tara:strand:+ start:26799 stop:27467 length:669 start_codon:yes stop_codon:yes gene_type:complete
MRSNYISILFIVIIFYSCSNENDKVSVSLKGNTKEDVTLSIKDKEDVNNVVESEKILSKRKINTNSIRVNSGNKIEIEGTIELLLPNRFETMPRETIKLKYPSAARPSSVYTNKEGTVNIALNHTITPMDNQGVDAYKIQFEGQLIQMGAKLIKSESIVKNGKNQVILEFISRAMDGSIYNLFVISHMDNHLVMVTFNCLDKEREEWSETAKKIIDSIKFSS